MKKKPVKKEVKKKPRLRTKTSRIKMVHVPREGTGIVFDRFMRFRYNGVIYTTTQHGVEKKDKVRIDGHRCFPNVHEDPKERKYLRSCGIAEKDWKMTDYRVPSKILDEIDALFPSRRRKL